jgi:hypothetical protein
VTTQRVIEDLASNETLLYIQQLEQETEKLRKQLKDVTVQLQSSKVCFLSLFLFLFGPQISIVGFSKVANASLSRTLDRSKRLG